VHDVVINESTDDEDTLNGEVAASIRPTTGVFSDDANWVAVLSNGGEICMYNMTGRCMQTVRTYDMVDPVGNL
jgi:hypothetical protein